MTGEGSFFQNILIPRGQSAGPIGCKKSYSTRSRGISSITHIFDDINLLLKVLHNLTDKGNTVIIIEHNLDVIKTADWIIDLGPEGGDKGGKVIGQGNPEEIINIKESYTGLYLNKVLTKS